MFAFTYCFSIHFLKRAKQHVRAKVNVIYIMWWQLVKYNYVNVLIFFHVLSYFEGDTIIIIFYERTCRGTLIVL